MPADRHARLMGPGLEAAGRAFFKSVNDTINQRTSNDAVSGDYRRAQLKAQLKGDFKAQLKGDWKSIQQAYDSALADARKTDNCDGLRDSLNQAEKLFWSARGWGFLGPSQLAMHQNVMPNMDLPK